MDLIHDTPATADEPQPPSRSAPPAPRPAPPAPSMRVVPRAFSCRCGRPIFFRNSTCLACGTALGYEPESARLFAIEVADAGADAAASVWHEALPGGATAEADRPRYWRCANLGAAAACNWLVQEGDSGGGQPALCRCCRLTRTLPDLTQADNAVLWQRVEQAKRRLVSSLIALRLPVRSKVSEDPQRGLLFDILRAPPGGPPVVTGHADGVITLDVEEADDAHREHRRSELAEPYRTLLGHLRHESGHYFWQRLVEPGAWLQPWRECFGDERQDYAGALQAHYAQGAPGDWGQRFVSAYASSHPWEDWAETWAHYLHLVDTVDTARSFGLDGERVELAYERFGPEVLQGEGDAHAAAFLARLNAWMELTGVLNELSRSMGMPDFYPFVLSAPAVRKLYLVHRIIESADDPSVAG